MIALELQAEDAACYAEVRAEVLARLAAGDLSDERHRKPSGGTHHRPRVESLPPGVVRFAERVHDQCDPWSYLTTADAARAGGVSEGTARQYIARLKDARSWPYRSRGR